MDLEGGDGLKEGGYDGTDVNNRNKNDFNLKNSENLNNGHETNKIVN